jgi:hypothetical protein
LSTLFQDAAMTTPVTANNDPVGAILDKSGNSRHLTQSTAGSRPLYKTSGGLHWLETDGSDDYIGVLFALSQPIDRVSAWRFLEAAGQTGALVTSTPDSFVQLYITAGELRIYAGTELSGLAQPAQNVDFVATERFNGVSSRVAIDNGSYNAADAGASASAGIGIGNNGALSDPATCRFYGLTQRGTVFTDAEIAQLRTYYGVKQGRAL